MFDRTAAAYQVRRWILLTAVVGVLAAAIPAAQDGPPLTNADVIRLVAAKLGDAIIITTIDTAPKRSLDVGVDGLIALKQAGASDAVIVAMQRAVLADRRPEPALRPDSAPSQPRGATTPPSTTSPAQPTDRPSARPAAIAPRQPTEMFTAFRVDPATGDLIPLENTKTKSGFSVVSLDGAASPITFKSGDRPTFAVLLLDTFAKLRMYKLERLEVRAGKRYASKTYVAFDIDTYGEPNFRFTKKGDVAARGLLLTPTSPLAPGQYAFSFGGLFTAPNVGAFGIEP